MRILVISDSHRNSGRIEKIIYEQPKAQLIFFLGDVTGDIDDIRFNFPDRIFNVVCGNCDFFSTYRNTDYTRVADKKIMFTHGHTYGVKYGIDNLAKSAAEQGCDIALYGHTHIPSILYVDGLYLVNPGSCAEPRNGPATYAVIDIEKNGILPAIINV